MRCSSPHCLDCGPTNGQFVRSVSTCYRMRSSSLRKVVKSGSKGGWTASGGQYISVKDTGAGIPEEEIPVVLASFGQGSNSIKSAEQGAGLGLPIAKSLVDLHGGTFTLKSKLRIGTEVIVTFPPERVVAAMAPIAEQAPSIAPGSKPEPSSDDTRQLNRKPLFRLALDYDLATIAQLFSRLSPFMVASRLRPNQ